MATLKVLHAILALQISLLSCLGPASGARVTSTDATASSQHARSLLQAGGTAASAVPHVARFESLLAQLGPGRPVTLKNVEAARFISYAQAEARASPGEDTIGASPGFLLSWGTAAHAV